jgi:2-polyprenyl-3-methyl-5-hydroxy-6-metoxy-1,4-benzoquinol methylase
MNNNTDKEQMNEKDNYFKLRNVDPSIYKNTILPIWIKNEIGDEQPKILDYGCGFGQIMSALKNEKYENVFGVDIEEPAINHCLDNNLNVLELDLQNLINPFDFKFDVIIISHVLEHMPKKEIIDTLKCIKKDFLTIGGKLLIAVPNAQSNTGGYWAYEDWTHTTLFTSGALFYVLRAAGFETIVFLDVDCTLGKSKTILVTRKFFLFLYKINKSFWNKITGSHYHGSSPEIFSYEIKAKAINHSKS